MDKGILLLAVPSLLNLIAWLYVLFIFIIPTYSIPLADILGLSIWTIIQTILFWTVWFPVTIYATIFGLITAFVGVFDD